MTRDEVFDDLVRRGVAKVEVSFSGGNDEGFVDLIRLLDAQGNVLLRLQEAWGEYKTPDDHLAGALAKPVYSSFGSFAGEFYVSGEFVWDVPARKVTYQGDEVPENKYIWEWSK